MVYAHRKLLLIAKLIRQEDVALSGVTMDPLTLRMVEHVQKRVGRPRLAWYEVTLEEFWHSCTAAEPSLRWAPLNMDNMVHIAFLKQAALAGFPSALPDSPPLLRVHQEELDGERGTQVVVDVPR